MVPRAPCGKNERRSAESDALENQRPVGAAETKIVFDCYIDFHVARSVGTKVQITLWVLIEQIDRRGCLLLVQRQHRENTFDSPGTTEQMARHRFRGADHGVVGVVT